MATYATKIAELRAQCGDIKRRIHVDWTGDGNTTVFQMPADTFPILESSYTVKLAGVTKTETTDYVLDRVSGTLTMVVAPGSNVALSIDCIAVYLLDADWLTVINNTILSLGDDFWKEFVETDITTTSGATSVSLTSERPKCIAVYEFQHKQAASDNWKVVDEFANWRYDRENNIIYVGRNDVFTVTGELLRIRGLETYTIGDEVSDTIDVQDRFMTIIEYGALARYWQWRYKSVVELVSKMSSESTRTPLQELMMLADRFTRQYETEKAKLKPQKPSRVIPRYLEGGGRP